MRGRERREKERKRRGGTSSYGTEQGRAKRPAVWGGAARPKTGQRMPHGVEERPAIGKSSIFMDEILTAEDGAHGRILEDVKVSFSQSFSPSRPLQFFLVSDHMKVSIFLLAIASAISFFAFSISYKKIPDIVS